MWIASHGRTGTGLALATAVVGLAALAIGSRADRPSTAVSTTPTGPSIPRPTEVAPTQLEPTQLEVFAGALAILIPGDAALEQRPDHAVLTTNAIRVEIDRWQLGSPHSLAGLGGAVNGRTLDEIAGEIDALIGGQSRLSKLHRGTLRVDYAKAAQWVLPSLHIHVDPITPFQVLIVVSGDSAYSFVGFSSVPDDPGTVLIQFGSLLTSINFLAPTHVVGLDGRIAFTLSGSDHIASSTADLITVENEGIALFSRDLVIRRATLGATLELRPSFLGAPAGVAVAGTNLDEYAASLRNANPIWYKPAQPTLVAGATGYLWRIRTGESILGTSYTDVVLVVDGNDVFGFVGDLEIVTDLRFVP